MTDPILSSIEQGVLRIELNRPEKKNAILIDMRAELAALFESAATRGDIRAVLLTGAGGDFCAGGDISEMGRGGLAEAQQRFRLMQRVMTAIVRCPKPVVCAVRGVAIGMGFSLALACDIVLADDSARFGLVQRRIGLPPDAGAVWLLSRHLGLARAKDLVMSASLLPAREAARLGLIAAAVAADELMPLATQRAAELASLPTLALGVGKQMFEIALSSGWDDFMRYETAALPAAITAEDFQEGIRAFLEKRPAVWRGR